VSFRPDVRFLIVLLLFAATAVAQSYTQRGFLENRTTLYPLEAANDSALAVGDALFRYEGFYRASNTFQFNGGMDLRMDTHHQVERSLDLSWWDRERRRPLVEVRRLSAVYHKGGLSVEAGKQFIRWGKADILNPTDRFAPRDYQTVVDNEFLGITAARATYETGSETVDVVWSPRLTPSRTPLQGQRWVIPPNGPPDVTIQEGSTVYPGGSQAGIRWNHIGFFEFSASFYQGFNHLPSFQPVIETQRQEPVPAASTTIRLDRFYPKLTMIGGDAAVPLRWFEVKGESGYFSSKDSRVDHYLQYVIQLERQSGEWSLVGGYAGEWVTRPGTLGLDFAPDRGITKTVLASAHYTIDANRSITFETSIRQNFDGAWARAEYSQAFGQHWRGTANVGLIRGNPSDFLGQYRRNGHATLILRYSF
jgi:hypothetical protein